MIISSVAGPNHRMPVRALRLTPWGLSLSNFAGESESSNARQGIKTQPLLVLARWRGLTSESSNARQGIKTLEAPHSLPLGYRSESSNARQGIKTERGTLCGLLQHLILSESSNARQGIKTKSTLFE